MADWIILTDNNTAIRFERFDYHADFRVFEAAWTTSWSSGGPADERWELFDCGDSWTLDQWEDAFWEIRGSVKWDGCINWETNQECMVHGCGPRHVGHITDIFNAVYAYAKRHHELLGDKAPPMPTPFVELSDAQGMSASGQDRETGLEAKPASPVGEADAPE